MWRGSGIVEDRALRQEVIVTTQRVFHRPLRAEPQFPLSAGDIRPLWRSSDGVEYRVVLRGRMRDGEAHFDAAGDKAEPRQDARRPDDVRYARLIAAPFAVIAISHECGQLVVQLPDLPSDRTIR